MIKYTIDSDIELKIFEDITHSTEILHLINSCKNSEDPNLRALLYVNHIVYGILPSEWNNPKNRSRIRSLYYEQICYL